MDEVDWFRAEAARLVIMHMKHYTGDKAGT